MPKAAQCVPVVGSFALTLAGAVLLAPAAFSARPQNAAPKGSAATGKTLFSGKMCNQCHGAAGQGTDAAPTIAGYPLTYADFARQVRQPANKMPAFDTDAVSDAQLSDIYAYMRSLPAPRPISAPSAQQITPEAPPPTAAQLGAGNVQNGARLFTADGCYECHNRAANGSPATGPRLAPNPVSVEEMIHELRHPNEMPPYTERVISDAEINDIHAYLASLPQPPNPNSIPVLSSR